ncbi:hypothetical protein [Streptomyces sp. NPDC087787]|uniref:hypothetical protein n=1 Tax=Streptomyces sp. NPDC087787 TaxID=3365803 RepID=UPI0038193579
MEITSDPDEIVQHEYPPEPDRPIGVTVRGPVETRELPARGVGYRTEQNVGQVAVRLLPLEARRKGALICAVGQDIWLAQSQAGAMAGAAGAIRIPAVLPWPVDHLGEVWACAVSGTTDISVQSSYWSE